MPNNDLKMAAIDPEAAAAIHENNSKRVIRAIEYYMQTGEKISVHNARNMKRVGPMPFVIFVLNDDRKSCMTGSMRVSIRWWRKAYTRKSAIRN